MNLILASKSPRRREILTMLGVAHTVLSLDTDEDGEREHIDPATLVMGLASRKVRAAWDAVTKSDPDTDDLLLSADTVVYDGAQVLEKPKDDDDARRMLSLLSGKRHAVYTGIAAMYRGKLTMDVAETFVTFRDLSEADISAYVASGEPKGKAGSYAVQGKGSLLVEKIEGDYYNVVGLPVARLDDMLKSAYGFGLSALQISKEQKGTQ